MVTDGHADGQATVITISVPRPEVAIDVLHLVSDLDDGVTFQRMSRSSGSTVEIDLQNLTDVQRETILYAANQGYYENPREITLDDLSQEFDVSKSAVSRRIRSAEGAILDQILGHLPVQTVQPSP